MTRLRGVMLVLCALAAVTTVAGAAAPGIEVNVREDKVGLTMWSADYDFADNPRHNIYEAYSDDQTRVGRSEDVSYQRPKPHASKWTGKAWKNFADNERYGWTTSVKPVGADVQGGFFIKNAYGEFFSLSPSTTVHTESDQRSFVTPTGTARFLTDYYVEIPKTETSFARGEPKVLFRKISWEYNRSRIANITVTPTKNANKGVLERKYPGYEDDQSRGYSRYTVNYDLERNDDALYAIVNITATVDRTTVEEVCVHENESAPHGAKLLSERSAECSRDVDPGPDQGDDPEDYSVYETEDVKAFEEKVVVTQRKPIEVYEIDRDDISIRVGRAQEADGGRSPYDQVAIQDTSERETEFASYRVMNDETVHSVARRWRFYTAVKEGWSSYLVTDAYDTNTTSELHQPMAVHAFRSDASPRPVSIKPGLSVEDYWGESSLPPVGIRDQVHVNHPTGEFERGTGVLSSHQWPEESKRVDSVEVQGLVQGESVRISSDDWTESEIRPTELSLSVVESSSGNTTLQVKLTKPDGQPISLGPLGSIGRRDVADGVLDSPIPDRGYVRVSSQYTSKRVYTDSDGKAAVEFPVTGTFNAYYVPRSVHVVDPAYQPSKATAVSHRFSSFRELLWRVISLALALLPFWVVWWMAGITSNRLNPFNTERQ